MKYCYIFVRQNNRPASEAVTVGGGIRRDKRAVNHLILFTAALDRDQRSDVSVCTSETEAAAANACERDAPRAPLTFHRQNGRQPRPPPMLPPAPN
ncbi:Hypothetical protein NTJ_08750 [Nesidiocoris tenuis]|uniref:Uncharacterized protein n=1 Tax=Nesidiocoris tenuis TaxID=355587 RepID=A0ABN7AYK1_9HEMI|nr:Hypothetical protein NTJ_08750 [Nesidiocoris tenuis]